MAITNSGMLSIENKPEQQKIGLPRAPSLSDRAEEKRQRA
jgi:hypothetical protein